jgi:hypothetical protein
MTVRFQGAHFPKDVILLGGAGTSRIPALPEEHRRE